MRVGCPEIFFALLGCYVRTLGWKNSPIELLQAFYSSVSKTTHPMIFRSMLSPHMIRLR